MRSILEAVVLDFAVFLAKRQVFPLGPLFDTPRDTRRRELHLPASPHPQNPLLTTLRQGTFCFNGLTEEDVNDENSTRKETNARSLGMNNAVLVVQVSSRQIVTFSARGGTKQGGVSSHMQPSPCGLALVAGHQKTTLPCVRLNCCP